MPSESIAVVGAGVIGMSCAIRLRERGRSVTIFAEKQSPDTTSDRAGAVFSPFRIDGHPEAALWTQTSYRAFADLAGRAGVETGVSMTALRELFFTPISENPWWAEFVDGFERLHDVAAPYGGAVRATVPKMDMRRYMPWLHRRFTEELGGCIVPGKLVRLESLFDRGHRVVVNCTGLGARELLADGAVTPRRGQILHLPPMALDECLVEESRGDVATYVIPFEDYTVIGGTYERDEWAEETQAADLAAIVERCWQMLIVCGYPPAADFGQQRLRAVVGLRPSRVVGRSDEAVRLEMQAAASGRWIMHNYGHGRVGVTLSWGCAEQVVRLIDEALV